jgi:hypothetical protein
VAVVAMAAANMSRDEREHPLDAALQAERATTAGD